MMVFIEKSRKFVKTIEIAKKVIDGLKKKHDGDYGAMVGALTSGFGG